MLVILFKNQYKILITIVLARNIVSFGIHKVSFFNGKISARGFSELGTGIDKRFLYRIPGCVLYLEKNKDFFGNGQSRDGHVITEFCPFSSF